jgi:PAS domain S-box-containing protein
MKDRPSSPRKKSGPRKREVRRRLPPPRAALPPEDLTPFFDSPIDLLCIGDPEAVFQKLNPHWETTLGHPLSEMVGRDFMDFIHPDDQEAAREAFHEMRRRPGVHALTNRVRCKDGSYRWLEWKYILRGEHIYASARDVTDRRRAEDELRESRRMLETVLNTIPARVFWKDKASNYLGCNQSFAQDAGFSSPAEVIGHNDFQLQWANQAERYRSDDRAVMETGISKLHYEEPGTPAENGTRWLMTSKIPLRDLDGNVRGVLGTYEDITDRRLAEKALRESESRYRQLFESESDAILLIDNETGRILEANGATSQLYGYSREELRTMRNTDLSAEPDETRRVTQTTPAEPEQLITIPLRFHRTKDGTVFPVEVTARFFTWRGRPVHITANRDITLRRKTEEELRESRQMLEMVLNTIPVRVFWKDRESKYLGCNKVFALDSGFSSPDELIGLDDYRMGWAEQADLYRSDDRLVIETGRPKLNYEEPQTTPAGTRIWLRTSKIPLRGPDGGIRGVLGTYEDITEYKRAVEEIRALNAELEQRVVLRTGQLEAANRELEAFSYSVSHDLRAPLRAIDGYTRILDEDCGKSLDEEGRRLCSVIRGNTRRMNELIDDLLTLSRLSRTEMEFLLSDMETMAGAVFQELTTPESRARIDFRLGKLPTVNGDPILLRQVWANLIANAIKFSAKRDRTRIEVECRSTPEEDVFSIRDNGAGFDMQYADRLFGVFQRLHNAAEFEGTGVGLAIVQRVIHRHGGRVWAESKPEKGAVFYFSLPKGGTGEIPSTASAG